MFKNLLLLLASLLFAVILGEVAFRIVVPERQMHVPRLINNELTYEPNQTQRSRYLEWDYEVRINSDGFRNDITLADLAPGSVLMLGDSFTEGYGVELKDSFSGRLQSLLQENGEASKVYNAGHYDTDITYYRTVYENVFRKVEAIETVIVGFFVGNDFIRSEGPYDGRLSTGNEFGDSFGYRMKTFLAEKSMIYAVLNYVLKSNQAIYRSCQSLGFCSDAWHPGAYFTQEFIDKAVPLTSSYLLDFAKLVQAQGRRFLVVLIPTREQVNDDQWTRAVEQLGPAVSRFRFAATDKLAGALKDARIEVLNLTGPALQHLRAGGAPLYFKHDRHWNAAGHNLAAREIHRQLQAGPDK